MKLHLPKSLFVAVMTVLAVMPALATTINQGSGQQLNINTSYYSAGDTLTLNVTGGHLAGDGDGATYTTAANLIIESLIIGDGYTRNNGITQKFTGTISGSGPITREDTQGRQYWAFTGDMTNYTGNITMKGALKKLSFGEDGGTMTVGATSVSVSSGSAADALSTHGNVTFNGTVTAANTTLNNGAVVLNGNASLGNLTLAKNAVVTVGSDATLTLGTSVDIEADETKLTAGNGFGSYNINRQIASGTVNATAVTTWKMNGTAVDWVTYDSETNTVTGNHASTNYYLNDATAADWGNFADATTVTVNATNGTVDLGNGAYDLRTLTINKGSVVQTTHDGANGMAYGDIVINSGTLSVVGNGQDAFGYINKNRPAANNYTDSLTLAGEDADNKAVLDLSYTKNNAGTVTFTTNLNMNGYAEISTENGKGINTFGGSTAITVSGTDNEISAQFQVRDNATMEVKSGASLLISGAMSKHKDGSGTLTKTGAGTLTITGDITDGKITSNAGTTLIKDNTITGTNGVYQGVTFSNVTANGTFTLNGYTGESKLQGVLKNLTVANTANASSTLKLGGGQYTFGADTDVNAHHMVFSGDTQINGHGYDGDGHTVALKNGASIDVGTHVLKLESEATLQVTNGSVTSGYIVLGHNTVTNPDQTKNPGFLTLAGGSITTGFIKANNGYAVSDNTFSMTGGTLTFTKPASETTTPDEGDPVTTTYNAIDGVTATISGGTLSTNQAAWKIDNTNASVGGVTISGTNSAELANVNLTSSITAQTGVSFSGTIHYMGTLNSREKARTTGNGFGTVEQYATIATGSGAVTSTATWLAGEQEMSYANKEITFDTGVASDIYYVNEASTALDITGANTLFAKQDATLAAGTYNLSGHAEVTNGATLAVATGTTLAAGTYLEVRANSTLTIGGTVTATDSTYNHGLWLHNGAKVVIENEGLLTVQGTTFESAEGETTITANGDTQIGGTTTMSTPSNTTITNAAMTITSGTFRNYNVVGGSLTVNSGAATSIQSSLSATTDLVVKGEGTSAVFGQTDITVQSLTLDAGTTVTLGTAADHDHDLTTTTLTVAGDSAINANLVVLGGGMMDFSSGAVLTMGCSVEIGNAVNVVIDEAIIDRISVGGQMVTIMQGVDEPITALGSVNFVKDNGDGTYGSLDYANLRLEQVGDKVMIAPEPATATLSLLALAALAARRRRH